MNPSPLQKMVESAGVTVAQNHDIIITCIEINLFLPSILPS